jgi:hypothetical protein
MRVTVTLADEKWLLRAVVEDLSSYRRTAEHDLTDWDERDAEILARTGQDPELAGLAEHALAHTVLPSRRRVRRTYLRPSSRDS